MRREAGPERRLTAAAGLAALLLAGCGAEPLALPAVVRGHAEVEVRPDGSPVPRVLDQGKPLGLCLEVPPAMDSSRWEALLTLDGEPSPTGFAPAAARMERTVCFEGKLPRGLRAGAALPLCGRLVDRFDDTERRLPCRAVRIGGDRAAHAALTQELAGLLASRAGGPLGPFLARLDALAARARDRGLPQLAVRVSLVASHFLTREGTLEALAEAGRRLDRLPAWLDRPEVSRHGAQAAYSRAELALARGNPAAAWQAYAEAERRYERIADPARFTVTMQQADLLSQAGAAREAVERLRADLAECARLPCEEPLFAYGQAQLAWLILLDPDATPGELDEAGRGLARALPAIAADGDPLQHANHRINLAYLQVRRGHDPAPHLAQARSLLAGAGSGGEGRSLLLGWADLVEGLAAVRRGDSAGALSRCGRLATAGDPALAARALSCTAEARRRQGDLAGADLAFAQSLARHEQGDAGSLGLRIPLGPGQRADDYAQAARVAVERGDPRRAWELLAGLDRLSANEAARRQCRERATDPAVKDRWQAIDAESAALQRELAALDRPASGERRRQLEGVRRGLQMRLQSLWREWPGCPEAAADPGDEGVRFRAVALADEVLLLGRDNAGRVQVERRTRMPRDQVRELVARLGAALDRRDLDDDAWRRLAAPLAAALLPRDPAQLAAVTTFALHGMLQGAPLAALPLPPGGGAPRWLSEVTAVALQPAGAREAAGRKPGAKPLFVVDPLGDLPGGSELVPLVRELFPGARILHREEARRDALHRALPGAAWLHLDTHGTFDPAFPELSSVELADGPLRLVELAGLPVSGRFANLSGCETGRWPFTADSGRYGLGGLLARLGVAWVVASRTDLEDRLARDFNEPFYRAIRSGRPVPAAYREALAVARRRHPAVSWAGLLLLRGARAEAEAEKQSPHPLAPSPVRPPVPHPERERGNGKGLGGGAPLPLGVAGGGRAGEGLGERAHSGGPATSTFRTPSDTGGRTTSSPLLPQRGPADGTTRP